MKDAPRSSRRGFLRKSSGILAGAALASSLSVARSAHAAEDSAIRVGLVGCGGRGKGAVVDCLHADENTKLVAACDAFADRAAVAVADLDKRFAGRIDVPADRIFTGFDAYQKVIDSGIDLVILATPPGFRPMHYKAAVAAGKHVFMEKPCCVDSPGYRSLVESNKLADEKNLKVGVGLQRRHQNCYLDLIQRIHDGAIGDLQYFRVYWNGAGVWNHPRKPGQTEMEYQMTNWYYFVWLCGDHICEQHIHNIDVANWIKGAHPVEAHGLGGSEVRKFGPQGDFGHIYDHHAVEFTYDDGTKMFSQCQHVANCWPAISEHATGTDGSADFEGKSYVLRDRKGKRVHRFRGESPSPYRQEHVDLIRAIRNDEKFNEGHVGAEASLSAIMGRMATYSGKRITWDEAAAGQRDEMPTQFAWDAVLPVMPNENGSYEHAVAVPGRYNPYV
ncbi:MAG: Gfo/Idh/MocA family oxidoreductase [Pirellulaceae bacterium]|nr:Gfo/Idh/MocA family oxidoreductase [Pirellulaceae bacterium]